MRTLVIGLGNPILTDDGVGIWTARAVAEWLPPPVPVDVIEVSVGGLSLMEHMVGYEQVIIVDAIKTGSGPPGAIYRTGMDSLPETMNSSSAHDASLATALDVGRSLGALLPENDAIDIIAIEAEDVLTFGDAPTPRVAAAVPVAAQLVLNVLAEQRVLRCLPEA